MRERSRSRGVRPRMNVPTGAGRARGMAPEGLPPPVVPPGTAPLRRRLIRPGAATTTPQGPLQSVPVSPSLASPVLPSPAGQQTPSSSATPQACVAPTGGRQGPPMARNLPRGAGATRAQRPGQKTDQRAPGLPSQSYTVQQQPGPPPRPQQLVQQPQEVPIAQQETATPQPQQASQSSPDAPGASPSAAASAPASAPVEEKSKKGRKQYLNLDDLRDSFNSIFGGKPPEVMGRENAGVEGRPIDLILNLFDVKLPNGYVYHYDVEIFPVCAATKDDPTPTEKKLRCASTLVNRKVIESLAKTYRKELGGCVPAFDGRKNMYTRVQLPTQESRLEHIFNNVEIEEEGAKRSFVVRVRYAATISFSLLHAAYEGRQQSFENFQDAIQAADVILRTGPTLRFSPVARSFFSPPQPSDQDCRLGGFCEAWFGFYSSIRLGAWKPVVNIDMSATAFYTPGPLIDFVAEILRKRNKSELSRGELSDRDRLRVQKEIRTIRVTTSHLTTKRQQRIEGLSRRNANQETFDWDGKQVSVAQYFKQKYNITMAFPHLPCVVVGKRHTLLPLEFCVIAPGQHCRKKLSEIQTAAMIRKTAITPRDRFRRISSAVRELDSSSKIFLKEFDMELKTAPMELKGRVLPPPVIVHGNGKKQNVRDGQWKPDAFLRPAVVTKWAIASLGRTPEAKTREMIHHFQREGQRLGMRIAAPVHVGNYGSVAAPRSVLEDVKNKVPDVDITVIVLDPSSPYGALKAEAETTDLCMRTQCVKSRNVETKMNPMFATNMLQKMNTKMGGQNNGIQGNMPSTLKQPFMAIGMDVNHPGPGDTRSPSVAAMVASMDPIPSEYHTCTSVQSNQRGQNQEYIVDTENMFLECLAAFQKRVRTLPKHVFIFRDGVSEAQFNAVRMYELGAIRKACLRVNPNFTPAITFIVVQKRHHVRMMPKNDNDGTGRAKNVPPGTIVDHGITHPGIFDFYLCSQQGIQGTSRPAHYHVVHDDGDHKPDEIYRLCYYLCHTYSRCARSVSIPAPAYYAHLAAFRAKEHMKGRLYDLGDRGSTVESSHGSSSSGDTEDLEKYQSAQRVVPRMRDVMYFV